MIEQITFRVLPWKAELLQQMLNSGETTLEKLKEVLDKRNVYYEIKYAHIA